MRKYHYIYIIFFIFLFQLLPCSYVQAEESGIVKVGYIGYPRFINKKSDGIYDGYGVNYLNEISKYTGWKYEYYYDTWENCLEKLKAGEIDILCSSQYTKERSKIYDYSKYPIGTEYSLLYTLPEKTDIYYNDYQSFNGIRIGLQKGSFQNEVFEEFSKENNFTYIPVEFETESENIEALKNKKVDAIVCGSLSYQDNLKVIAKFSRDPFYIITQKGNTALLDPLNNALEQIQMASPYFEVKLYEKYYGSSAAFTQPLLSRQEVSYARQKPALKVGYNINWYPYEYMDKKTKKPAGAVFSLFHKLSSVSGFQFTFIPFPDTASLYDGLKNGKIELLAVDINDGKQSQSGCKYTNPFMYQSAAIVGNDPKLDFSDDVTVGFVYDFKSLKTYLSNYFPVKDIKWYSSIPKCLEAVDKGEVDVTLIDNYYQNLLLQKNSYKNLTLISNMNINLPMSIGMRDTANPLLLSILNKSISTIPESELSKLLEANSQKTTENFFLILKQYWIEFTLCIIVLLFFIALFVIRSIKAVKTAKNYDSLTKSYSLKYFEEYTQDLFRRKGTDGYCIIRFDISHFKYINQYYGRAFGDKVLKAVVKKAEESMQEEEIIARIADDNFIMLLKQDSCKKFETDIFYKLENLRNILQLDNPIYIKAGIYNAGTENETITSMIDKAGIAQRSIKDNPNKIYKIYNDQLKEQLQLESIIEFEMKPAIDNHEFQVYYQPQIDLNNLKIVGAEALIRWIRKDGTMVYPDQFIPVFERNGFIETLDFYVLECVCQELRKNIDKGYPVFPISVNQSRFLLTNPHYIDHIDTILKRYEIDGRYIELELTESMYIENKQLLFNAIERLHKLKIPLSIDDFGSGYSSLNLITEISAEILKIDRAFLFDCEQSSAKLEVIKNVVHMAHALNMTVICEGVETKEQELFLQSIGCDMGQGYLYSKPISLDDLKLFIKDWKGDCKQV